MVDPNQNQQTGANEPSDANEDFVAASPFQDGTWYDGKAARLPSNNNVGWTMGPSGASGDSTTWDLDVDPGNGVPLRRQFFNNMSTPAGLSILCYTAKYLGCKGGDDMDQWVVDPTITVSVLFESEEYPIGSGHYTQKIKKVWPKRPVYEPKIVKAKAASYREKIAAAQAQNADYEQKKAAGQFSGGGNSGRSNSLPADPGDAAGRADFGREPEGNAQPFGGGQAPANGGRRARF